MYVNESDFLDDPYVIHLRKELGNICETFPQTTVRFKSTK